MNKFIISGRLTKDVELSFLPGSGKAAAKFTIAVDRNFKNSEGKREADFFNVSVYGPRAESLANITFKGQKVLVEGRVQNRSYTDKEGNKKYLTEVIAREFEILEWKDGQAQQQNTPEEMTEVDDGDIPF